MKIGIDVSQLAYENTGVANYLYNLVDNLLKIDKENEYVLFFSSLRKKIQNSKFKIQNYNSKVKIIEYKIPPTILDFMWNRLHMFPIENFVGDVDVFITSDWTEPPAKKAKKITILYDLTIYKYPEETHNEFNFNPFKLLISPNIVAAQKRKLKWVKKESDRLICISDATKKDAKEILGIESQKMKVVYPGL